jgi:hypothetical protein
MQIFEPDAPRETPALDSSRTPPAFQMARLLPGVRASAPAAERPPGEEVASWPSITLTYRGSEPKAGDRHAAG